VSVPTGIPGPVPLTGSAALLHLADEDAQAMLGATTDAEAQLAVRALLHRDGIDDVALVAVGCGDRGWDVSPGLGASSGRGVCLAGDVPSPRTTLPAPRPGEPRHPVAAGRAGGQGDRRAPHAPSMGVLMRMTRPMGEVARPTRTAPLSRRLCLLSRQRGARLASLLELRDRLPAVIPGSDVSQPCAMPALGTPASRRPARRWPRPHGAGAARRPGGDMA